jgi:hypothetical protein
MRYKMLALAGLASILAIGALAKQQGQTPSNPAPAGPGMMGQQQGMMGGGMMIGRMMAHHQQMTELMNKLMQSMTAIQNEKNPEALKAKIAEHQALLSQMRDQMAQQGSMMQNMFGHMQHSGPMMGATPPPSDTAPAK